MLGEERINLKLLCRKDLLTQSQIDKNLITFKADHFYGATYRHSGSGLSNTILVIRDEANEPFYFIEELVGEVLDANEFLLSHYFYSTAEHRDLQLTKLLAFH